MNCESFAQLPSGQTVLGLPLTHNSSPACHLAVRTQAWEKTPVINAMKLKTLVLTLCASVLLAGVALAADKTCCEKAKEAGKACTHPCCVEATKAGKTCEKCNKKEEKKEEKK
jgi:hypothetical protein